MGFLGKLFSKPRQPDIHFAVEGFWSIALVRRNHPEADLDDIELGNTRLHVGKGCTEEQALSLRWGSMFAMRADLYLFQLGLDAYEAGIKGIGEADGRDPKEKYRSAATLVIRTVLNHSPNEYEQFLRAHPRWDWAAFKTAAEQAVRSADAERLAVGSGRL